MGYGPRIFIPSWTATIGALQAEGAEVTAHCPACSCRWRVDLARIRAAKGPLYSLWNRTTSCPTQACQGRVWFSAARPDAGTWPTNMRDARRSVIDPLHAAWRASRGA